MIALVTFSDFLHFFDATEPEKIEPGRRPGTEAVAEKAKRLLCRFCLNPVTDDSRKTTALGRFVHCRINPAGVTFEFGCYSDAPGCSTLGEATTEHTWFPGHSWKLAICRSCGEHLGWLFKGDASFYGLIRDRLIPEE